MFDAHLSGHHRLAFYAHGPEWAFIIADGDYDALIDVIRVCSRVWNGGGALILPARADGRLRGDWKRYIATRPIDETWLHPSLTAAAQTALKADSALRPMDWNSGFGFDALHPTRLIDAPVRQEHRLAMTAPMFASASLQRVADITWGVVEHPHEWREHFDVGLAESDLAFTALVGGQLGFNMASPLRVSQVSMDVFAQWDNWPWPYLWVFQRGTFDEVIAFWNFRSAAAAGNRLASVIGIPQQALAHPDRLQGLRIWADASTGTPRTPTLLVKAAPKSLPRIEKTLAAIGIDRLAADSKPRRGVSRHDAERPTWLPWPPVPNGRMLRGARNDIDFSVQDGQALVSLPRPRGYRHRGGARLVLQTLPTPLPITAKAARRIFHGAFAHPQGLGINMGSASPWSLTLQLPDHQTALDDWAADHRYTVHEPRPAKDARALVQRLGDLHRLDALSAEGRLEVLVQLAPLSRRKLVDRLATAFAPSGDRNRLADELTETLREEGLLLELDGRTAEQLNSALPESRRRDLIAALQPLVEAGFVHRGRNVRCPRCAFAAFVALRELDEHVRCRGCRLEYLLPVTGAGGTEAQTAYRLDGLMARVMDQHVLPVLLTLRALRDPARVACPEHVWPGVLFRSEGGDRPFDIDLLASDGVAVYAAECKLDARGLGPAQLRTLLDFTDRVAATPVIAALAGEFAADVRRAIEERDGLVLQRRDLLTIGQRPT